MEQAGRLHKEIAKKVRHANCVNKKFNYTTEEWSICSTVVLYREHSKLSGVVLIIFPQITEPSTSDVRTFRGHQLPPTCMVISPDDKYIFSAGKDCSIIKCE